MRSPAGKPMVGDSRGHEQARPGGASASWSPRTTLGRCWRSRAVALLGGWLIASPWALATTEETTSLQSALVSGSSLLLLAGWAMLSREPWLAHLVVASIGIWLLLAPSFWYFTSRPASWNSISVGLATLVLATWTLAHGPRRRPPFDSHDGHAQRSRPASTSSPRQPAQRGMTTRSGRRWVPARPQTRPGEEACWSRPGRPRASGVACPCSGKGDMAPEVGLLASMVTTTSAPYLVTADRRPPAGHGSVRRAVLVDPTNAEVALSMPWFGQPYSAMPRTAGG
jgi:hypothetical protein